MSLIIQLYERLKMKVKSKAINITVLVFFIFSTVTPSYAGWVDDWLNQHTSASSGYFSGQQRGYYTFGSFSGRMTTGTLNPISVAPPRINVGCGGIDVFLGSMSFTNFEYLVQKFQTIMQNAPAVAFELALSVLSEQTKGIINDIETLLNLLNNIQINDCQATKGMVAYVANKALNDNRLGEMATRYLQKTGIVDFYKKAKETIQGSDGDAGRIQGVSSPVLQENTAGCVADLIDVFGTGGSILEHLATRLNIPAIYVDLIRGYAGDIDITVTGGIVQGTIIPSCFENNAYSLDDFLKGDVYMKDNAGSCVQITDFNKDLLQYVSGNLLGIMNNLLIKQNLTASQKSFLDSIPLPIYTVLKSSVGTGQEAVIISLLSDVTARAFVYMMLADMYKLLHDLINEGRRIITSQQGPDAGKSSHECMIEKFDDLEKKLEDMKSDAYALNNAVREVYGKSAEEVNTILDLVSRMKGVEDLIHTIVSSRYSQQVADRVMGVASSD
jgi:conjugative transfer pilus assembly protein TraH